VSMPAELRVLIEKYNALGRLLPPEDEWESMLENPRALAQAKVVLAEMARTKRQFDDFLLRHGRGSRARSPSRD
jgi:hypothetical protein